MKGVYMSGKRKDSKGRVLKSGESQRKNGQYIYQYTDTKGCRKVVYAWRLVPTDITPHGKREDLSLREKEKQIHRDIEDGICSGNKMTVTGLMQRYTDQKIGIRYGTKQRYRYQTRTVARYPIGNKAVHSVKKSDAKAFLQQLIDDGYSQDTVIKLKCALSLAFQMAIDDDIIRKNPFKFQLDGVISKRRGREALTLDEETKFLSYVKSHSVFSKHYDEIFVLLHTGLRVSEFAGLTIDDIDFDNHVIKVRKQLCKAIGGRYYIQSPKSSAGIRDVPMTVMVEDSIHRLIANRSTPDVEPEVDGYSRFLVLSTMNMPKVTSNYDHQLTYIVNKYNETHDDTLPKISPHVLRHTFCTRMVYKGMNPKTLQYIMGHANISLTLNVYAHTERDKAIHEMLSIYDEMPFESTTENTSKNTSTHA